LKIFNHERLHQTIKDSNNIQIKKITISIKTFAALVLTAVIATSSFAQDQQDSANTVDMPKNKEQIKKSRTELASVNEDHKLLSSLVGSWSFYRQALFT